MPLLTETPASSAPPSGAAGGDLTGTYPSPTIAALAVTDAKVATANKDGAAGTASMRTLGTGATQATAGNDSRLSDSRTPSGAAGGVLGGTYPNPTLATPTYLRPGVSVYARGLLTENQPPVFNNAGTLPTQVAVYMLVTLYKGDVAKGLRLFVNTAGTSTSPTGIYVGLYDSTLVRRAVSSNLNASAIWATSGTYADAAFAATYTIPADGYYWAAILQDGAFGGTALAVARSLSNSGVQNVSGASGQMLQQQQAGQAALPDPMVPSLNGQSFYYCGVYY